MKKLLVGLKNIILWSYERATWQYDLLCLLIIAAIFLIPGQYFGDRDRPLRTAANQAASVGNQPDAAFKSAATEKVLRRWDIVEMSRLSTFAARHGQAEALKLNPPLVLEPYLREMIRADVSLERYEIERDKKGQITGYRVWFQ